MSDGLELIDVRTRLHAGVDSEMSGVVSSNAPAPVAGLVLADRSGQFRGRAAGLTDGTTVRATAGLAPDVLAELDEQGLREALDELERALDDGDWCAVGPTGLDFSVAVTDEQRRRQKRALVAQLRLACRYELPVTLVVRDGYNSLIQLMRQQSRPGAGGVLHDYDGSPRQVGPLLMVGLDISFGPALFGQNAGRVQQAVGQVPRDRLLVETNCGGVAGGEGAETYRGPLQVVERIGQLRRCSPQQVARWTVDNARERLGFGR